MPKLSFGNDFQEMVELGDGFFQFLDIVMFLFITNEYRSANEGFVELNFNEISQIQGEKLLL